MNVQFDMTKLGDEQFDEELRFTDEEDNDSWSMNIEEAGPYFGQCDGKIDQDDTN